MDKQKKPKNRTQKTKIQESAVRSQDKKQESEDRSQEEKTEQRAGDKDRGMSAED
jgi:hypothetical protein